MGEGEAPRIMNGGDVPAYPPPKDGAVDLLDSCLHKFLTNQYYRVSRAEVAAFFRELGCSTQGMLSIRDLQMRIWSYFSDETVTKDLQVILEQSDASGEGLCDIDEFHQALRLGVNADAVKKILRGAEKPAPDNFWVKRGNILGYLQEKQDTSDSCASLPYYLTVFAVAFVLVLFHLQTQKVYSITGPARDRLNNFQQIVPDWNEDLQSNWLPFVRNTMMKDFNLAETAQNRGRWLNYFQLVGGVKVTRQNVLMVPCTTEKLDDFYQPAISQALDESTMCQDGLQESADDTFYLAASKHDTQHETILDDKISNDWVTNDRTLFTELALFFYNGQSNMYVYMRIVIERARVGAPLTSSTTIETFSPHPYNESSLILIFDAIYVVLVGYSMWSEITEFFPMMWRRGLIGGFKKYINLWNAIDWFNNGMSGYIMYFYYGVVTNTGKTNDAVIGITSLNTDTEIEGQVKLIQEYAALTAQGYSDLKWFLAVYCISAALVFFKGFRANPKLNVVYETLARAWADLFHFTIVFGAILFVFVLVGHIILGAHIEWFNTSTGTLEMAFFQMLGMCVDPIRDKMIESGGFLGLVWFFLFTVIVSILLLNMILAIIFDIYAEVKSELGDSHSIFEQIQELIEAKRRRMKKLQERSLAMAGGGLGAGMKGLTAVTSVVTDGAKAVGTGVKAVGNTVVDVIPGADQGMSVVIPGAVTDDDASAVEQGVATQKTGDGSSASLWSQESEKKWNAKDMVKHLEEKNAHPNSIVTKESLMECFNGLEEDDAEIIMDESDRWVRSNKLRAELSMEDILRLVGRIDSNMREAKERYVFTNKQLGADDDRVLKDRKRGENEDRITRIMQKLKEMKQKAY